MEELKSLNELYPNLGSELENRHSAHYSSMRRRFCKIYQDLEPHYFVSVKGTAKLVEVAGTSLAVSMALENGVVMAVATTYPGSDVYFNSAETQEEVVLNCKGQVKFGESQLATVISQAFESALGNYPVTKLMGGIIYFDVNIRQEAPGYLEAVKVGVALAALLINNFRNQSIEELNERVLEAHSEVLVSSYQNGTLLCGNHACHKPMTELVASQVNLGNNVLLFFDLPLTAEEVEHIQKSKSIMDRELWELEKIASGMLNDHPSSINVEDHSASPKTIIYLLRNGQLAELAAHLPPQTELLAHQLSSLKIEQEGDQPSSDLTKFVSVYLRRLHTLIEQYGLAASLSAGVTTELMQHALNKNTEIALRYNMQPQRVRQILVTCSEYEVLASTFTPSNHLAVLCSRKKMLALFDRLKKDLLQTFEHTPNYQEKHPTSIVKKLLFSTLPSRGCGVLNPNSELWYM